MAELPCGTVTFLFTDIEGSTRLVQRLGRRFRDLLETHQRLIRDAVSSHDGVEIRSIGDGLFIAFERASDAVGAALQAQLALESADWPEDGRIAVRMGMHTGEAVVAGGDYVGLAVHEAARVAAAGHGGQVLVTEATRALAADELAPEIAFTDLGMHRLKDLLEPFRLYQLVHPGLRTEFAPLRSLSVRPNNLPVQLTSFVGRETEVSELAHIVPTVRLLTLTGMGGTGKTRLAIEAAGDLLAIFPDGVWFVDLAPLTDVASVPAAVLSAIGAVAEPGRDPLDVAAHAIGDGSMLLILDNCEHVLDACARVADRLIKSCASLRILATSREPLGLDGETVRHVPPLGLPTPDAPVEQIAASDAARLFLDRALSAGPTFEPTPASTEAIGRIVARLDGIPLAIELAAARARVLSPQQIDERLDDVFGLLTSGKPRALPRQRTLRAAVEWSHDLLEEDERVLFRRVSVFAGGFDVEAVEAVCAGEDMAADAVLDLVQRLAEKSLLYASMHPSGSRYRMLDVVRRYAAERLAASGEADQIRDAHLAWFAQAVRRRAREDSGAWLDRLAAEQDNVRAALSWGTTTGSAEQAAALAVAMASFWQMRGSAGEGYRWVVACLARGSAEDSWRGELMQIAGNLADMSGEFQAADRWYDEALAFARGASNRHAEAAALSALGDRAHANGDYESARNRYSEALEILRDGANEADVAALLSNLGNVAHAERDYRAALRLYEQSLQISRARRDPVSSAASLQSMGRVLVGLQRHAEARAAYEEALTIARELGDRRLTAFVLSSVGTLERSLGDAERALAVYEEALQLRKDLGDAVGEAATSHYMGETLTMLGRLDEAGPLLHASYETFSALGLVLGAGASTVAQGTLARARGDLVGAAELYRQGLDMLAKLGDPLALAEVIEPIAGMALHGGKDADGVRLLAASSSLREAAGTPMSPHHARTVEADLLAARTRLGDDAFDRAWDAGRAMNADDAIAAARDACC